jgi:cysteate synthase
MYAILNNDAKKGVKIFEELEGIDIFPPAGVAVASLIEAVDAGRVTSDDRIVLNITGGGVKRVEQDYHLHKIEPTAHAENANIPLEEII